MAKFVYNKDLDCMVDKITREPMVSGEWTPRAPMVFGFDEYASPISGEPIGDRATEKAHMAKHDVIPAAELRAPRKLKNERFINKHGLQSLG